MPEDVAITPENTEDQKEMFSESEVKKAGLYSCKIDKLEPNKGTDSGGASVRITLSTDVDLESEPLGEIIPEGIMKILGQCADENHYPFSKLPFSIGAGINIRLALRQGLTADIFNEVVTLNKSAHIDVVGDDIKLSFSFTKPLNEIDYRFPYTAISLFKNRIFCKFFKEETKIADPE